MAITAFLSRSPGLLNRSLGAQPHWDMFLIPASSPTGLNFNCSMGGPEGPLLNAGFLYRFLSPTHLISNWSELQLLNRVSWGPTLQCAGFLYNISPTDWTSCAPSYIIFRHTPSSCGHHKSHSFNPSTIKVIFWYPWSDADVIYTGVFPILTAQPGRRSIYNNHPLLIFPNFTCEIFLHVYLHNPQPHILQNNSPGQQTWKKYKKKLLESQQNKILLRKWPSPYIYIFTYIGVHNGKKSHSMKYEHKVTQKG